MREGQERTIDLKPKNGITLTKSKIRIAKVVRKVRTVAIEDSNSKALVANRQTMEDMIGPWNVMLNLVTICYDGIDWSWTSDWAAWSLMSDMCILDRWTW
ncbi:hypothetical protein Tco_0691114 [Tanacetum coccineum]